MRGLMIASQVKFNSCVCQPCTVLQKLMANVGNSQSMSHAILRYVLYTRTDIIVVINRAM